ncbi:MAG: hypothetical protein ACOX4O_12545 [Eubacteriales bacterium]
MKLYLKPAALILALLIAISAVSCGGTDTKSSISDLTEAAPDEQTATETEKPSITDSLDFKGAEVRFSMSNTDISSAEFLEGPEEQTGDMVLDAVWQRNLDVQEKLNVNFKYTDTDVSWSSVADYVRKMVLSGTDDFDIIVNDQRGLSTVGVEKLLRKAQDCDYFDFTTQGWWLSYMEDLSVKSGETYLLVGDYFMDVLRRSHLLYYNRTLFENIYGDPDSLYSEVIDSTWTFDRLAELAAGAYADLNGDGKSDKNDQFGLIIGGIGGSIFPYVYSGDYKAISRDEDGFPYLDFDLERAQTLYEKVYNCFYGIGTFTKFNENGVDLHEKFISGTALFISTAEIANFENFRAMENDIGLVPYPKTDETQQSYNTVVHDTAEIGCIPITTQEYNMASAVIQALNEATAKSVTPVYYENALKIKYVRDEYSAQMIDLIHDGINGQFTLIYGGEWANDIFTWTFLQPLKDKGDSISSEYAKRESAAKEGLEKLRATYESNG